jgi:imidazolonepropionase-like amidohydrolase
MEAIVAATVTAAEHIGQSASLGTIEPGKAADVIAVGADPLDDISALLNIMFVMRDGRVFKHART